MIFRSALMAALVATAGCTSILDSHDNGNAPPGNGQIPGPPSGDSLTSAGQVTFNASNIELRASTGSQTAVAFRPVANHGDPDEYTITSAGVTLLATPEPVLAIDTIDTAERRACGLKISGGEFRLVGGRGTSIIGNYRAADEHRIIMRLSKTSARCFVNIRQFVQGEGPNSPLTQPVIDASAPFIDPDFDILGRLQFAWETVPAGSTARYFIGPVSASAR